MSFGALLRRYRLEAGLTQRDLAELAGVGAETISAHERGVHPAPYRDTVMKIADGLALSDEDRLRLEASVRRIARPRVRVERHEATATGSPAVGRSLGSLPCPLTRLVGRMDVVRDVVHLATSHRLVTLTGTGGVGKTRVAIEAASAVRDAFEDGVWFVDMSPIFDGGFVPAVVATALGVRTSDDRPLDEALAISLRSRTLFILLDNCERVVADVAAFVEMLLVRCPTVHVLATSRQRLSLASERVIEIRPFALPNTGDRLSARVAAQFDAVTLFVERAQAADRHFALTDENASLVGNICRQLDGLALPIELAAPKIVPLGLKTLHDRLQKRLRLLSSGDRRALHHHRTLRALLDWSHDSLLPCERALLARVAVFSGGWTLQAAEAVCAAGELSADGILEVQSRLVEKSLITMRDDRSEARYYLLDCVREYALDRLAESQDARSVSVRHAEWIAVFAESRAAALWTCPRRAWIATIAPEIENVRAALAWAVGSGGSPALAASIATSMSSFWYDVGLYDEGRRWLESIRRRLSSGAGKQIEGRLLLSLAGLSDGARRVEIAAASIASLEEAGDRDGLALAYNSLGFACFQIGDFDRAVTVLERATASFAEAGRERSTYYAISLGWRALALIGLGRITEARVLFERDIAILEALGDRERAAIEQLNYAGVEFAADDVRKSLVLVEAASAAMPASPAPYHNETFSVAAYLNATACRLVLGEIDRAADTSRKALEVARRVQNPYLLAIAVQHAAALIALRGDGELAGKLLGYVERCFDDLGVQREPAEQRSYDILNARVRHDLSPDNLARVLFAGSLLDADEAYDMALRASGSSGRV